MRSFRNTDEALPRILDRVMKGEEVGSRAGRTRELLLQDFHLTKPLEREVLVPGRKASLAAQIAETMWVLAGRNDVAFLEHYLPRAADFSDDGATWRAGYGQRLRAWHGRGDQGDVDQLAVLVDEIKNNRGTRRAVMSIYDPGSDFIETKDVPCNNWLSFISRMGYLHLNIATRSNDVIWGWSGINQFEWSALQEIVAHLTGNRVGVASYHVTSLHVYERHYAKAQNIIQEARYGINLDVEPEPSPRFHIEDTTLRTVEHLDLLISEWFRIEHIVRHRSLESRQRQRLIDTFPEPMMRSWLRVLDWWWGNDEALSHAEVADTRLDVAARRSPKRPEPARRVMGFHRGVDLEVGGNGYPVNSPQTIATAQVRIEPVFDLDALQKALSDMEPLQVPVTPQVVHVPIEINAREFSKQVSRMSKGGAIGRHLHVPVAPSSVDEAPTVGEVAMDDGGICRNPVSHRLEVASVIGAIEPEPEWHVTKDNAVEVTPEAFIRITGDLHEEKSAAYGDSWKRRGEMLGILANIARKVDRLVGGETADETSADTATDLLIYLTKYTLWLRERRGDRFDVDEVTWVRQYLHGSLGNFIRASVKMPYDAKGKPEWITAQFAALERQVQAPERERNDRDSLVLSTVSNLLAVTAPYAYHLWAKEQRAA